jgi:hypothetical protein
MGNCAERTFAGIVDRIVNTCINRRASFCNQTREEIGLNKNRASLPSVMESTLVRVFFGLAV